MDSEGEVFAKYYGAAPDTEYCDTESSRSYFVVDVAPGADGVVGGGSRVYGAQIIGSPWMKKR